MNASVVDDDGRLAGGVTFKGSLAAIDDSRQRAERHRALDAFVANKNDAADNLDDRRLLYERDRIGRHALLLLSPSSGRFPSVITLVNPLTAPSTSNKFKALTASKPRRPPAAQAGDDAREPHNNNASSPTHPAETAA